MELLFYARVCRQPIERNSENQGKKKEFPQNLVEK
jgi:hypothetical protein